MLDYGAQTNNSLLGKIQAIFGIAPTDEPQQGVTNVTQLNQWAANNGYAVLATPASPSQINAAIAATTTVLNTQPTYSLIAGSTCISQNINVISASGAPVPSTTSQTIPGYPYSGGNSLLPVGVVDNLRNTPGWQPLAVYFPPTFP